MKPAHPDTELPRLWQPLTLALILGACVLTAILRLKLVPLPWNLTPVGALALFAGARLRSWQAFALPPLLMFLTDVLVANHFGYALFYPAMPFVYAGFLLNVVLGRWVARTENPVAVGGAAVAGSVQFFLVSNFGVWLTSALNPADPHSYEASLAGLWTCYAMAVPFFRGTFFGDLIFCAVLFGAHALLSRTGSAGKRVPVLAHTETIPEARP
jgi:hypothetical protein